MFVVVGPRLDSGLPRCVMIWGEPAFEASAGFEPKDIIQLHHSDDPIHGRLPVLAVDLGENKPGGVAVVKTAKARLHLKQPMCLVESHTYLAFGENTLA
jgi:hypothetical protein